MPARTGRRRLPLILAIFACTCRQEPPAPDPPPDLEPAPWTVQTVGTVRDGKLDEISGFARSYRHPGLLWTLEDNGNKPRLYALRRDGSTAFHVKVAGAKNRDWEAVASFARDGRGYLVVGDVGDNDARYDEYRLHVFIEPAADAKKAKPAWSITYSYEDGARDCEAIAVDGDRIVLLSKRDKPPGVYELALEGSPQVARRIGTVEHLPVPTPRDLQQRYGEHRAQITDLDIAGDVAVVMTYKDAYLYARHPQGWGAAFGVEPLWLDVPQMLQPESVAFDADGALWFSSEQVPSPLYKAEPQVAGVQKPMR